MEPILVFELGFLNLKKCVRIGTKGFTHQNNQAQTPLGESPNKSYNVKSKTRGFIKKILENLTIILQTCQLYHIVSPPSFL
jgi:hypothetical protein